MVDSNTGLKRRYRQLTSFCPLPEDTRLYAIDLGVEVRWGNNLYNIYYDVKDQTVIYRRRQYDNFDNKYLIKDAELPYNSNTRSDCIKAEMDYWQALHDQLLALTDGGICCVYAPFPDRRKLGPLELDDLSNNVDYAICLEEPLDIANIDLIDNGGDEDYHGICMCSQPHTHDCYRDYSCRGHRHTVRFTNDDILYYVCCHS